MLFLKFRYGDIAPTTPAGRVIACLCALSGAGTIAMLVSVLVDRYQRVYTRKLYVKPEQIDFGDYSDGDDAIDSKHGNRSSNCEEGNLNIEDQQEEAPKFEHVKDQEATTSRLSLSSPDLSKRSSNHIDFAISHPTTDDLEDSHIMLERIRSILSEKQFNINDIDLGNMTDTWLTQLPSSHPQFSFDLNGENDNNDIHLIGDLITASAGDRNNENSVRLSSQLRDRVEQTTL